MPSYAEHWQAEIGIELEECLKRMRAAFEEHDFAVSWQCDLEFHQIISFYLSQRCAAAYYPQAPEQRILREHELIVTVLRTRDGNRVERVVRRVLERSSRKAFIALRRIWREERRVSSHG